MAWPEPVLNRRAELRGDAEALADGCAQAEVMLVGADGAFLVRRDPGSSVYHLVSSARGWSNGQLLIGEIPAAEATRLQMWCARLASTQERAADTDPNLQWTTLRNGDLEPDEREVAEAAVALAMWHATEPTCDRCHLPTTPTVGGGSRHCEQGHESFPRTDPAVIMAVVDAADRLLLAHQTSWGAGRCSVLAGFVEAGEAAETAVLREVAEEVGLRATEVRYLHSQPWPFPRSLMLGFTARAEGEPKPDGVEIEWAHWFTREQITQQVGDGTLILPGPASIAGRMIDLWRHHGI